MNSILKYTTPAYGTRFLIVFIDLFLYLLAFFTACFLRFNFDWDQSVNVIIGACLVVMAVRILSTRLFRTYSVIVRFSGSSDALNVFFATLFGSIVLLLFAVLIYHFKFPFAWQEYGSILPVSVLLIDFFLSVGAIIAFRLLMPFIFNLFFQQNRVRKNATIIGAGELGALTLRMLKQDLNNDYRVLGIFDDNPDLKNKFLDGVPVYSPSEFDSVINDNDVGVVILAIRRISLERKNAFVDMALANDVKVLQVPYNQDWLTGNIQADQLREMNIEDLLNRHPILLGKDQIQKDLRDKVILVTGGAGSIGSELARQIVNFEPKELIILDQAETPLVNLGLSIRENYDFSVKAIIGDVTDKDRIRQIFEEYKPNVVFHAAAYKHVPIMEDAPYEAIRVNVMGSKNVADLSAEYEADKFVMVSTDKAVNPTNVMGASKRLAELYVKSIHGRSQTQFIITRFGNVLGSNGSVIPRFKKQILAGGPVTVTHKEITRYFMTIPEASQLVLEAGTIGNGGEIFLFDMGEPVKIDDLAKKLIKLSGLVPNKDIEIAYTGLRPGEKLYEELLTSSENSIKTHHPKITKAKAYEFDQEIFGKGFLVLQAALMTLNDEEIVNCMKKLVPEYLSKNSKYEKLDAKNI